MAALPTSDSKKRNGKPKWQKKSAPNASKKANEKPKVDASTEKDAPNCNISKENSDSITNVDDIDINNDENKNDGQNNNEFSLTTVKGDLFTCASNASMAHCVSRDLAMSKGIAVLFKKKFGQIDYLLS